MNDVLNDLFKFLTIIFYTSEIKQSNTVTVKFNNFNLFITKEHKFIPSAKHNINTQYYNKFYNAMDLMRLVLPASCVSECP